MDDLTPPRSPSPSPSSATVPSGRGSAWWREGWRLFTAAPGVWIAITVIFVVLMVMITIIPMLGTLATTILSPVFAGGVLIGCRALDRGGALTIGHLFACFSEKLSPLVIVGVLFLVGELVIVTLVAGGLLATIGIGSMKSILSGDPMEAGWAMLATFGIGAVLALLVGLVLGLPLMMAYWYAPSLVVFRNDEPIVAMKASFHACLVNVMPMFVYSLVGLVLAIVATIPFGLGWLVLAPVFAASVYASYKDIFGAPE